MSRDDPDIEVLYEGDPFTDDDVYAACIDLGIAVTVTDLGIALLDATDDDVARLAARLGLRPCRPDQN